VRPRVLAFGPAILVATPGPELAHLPDGSSGSGGRGRRRRPGVAPHADHRPQTRTLCGSRESCCYLPRVKGLTLWPLNLRHPRSPTVVVILELGQEKAGEHFLAGLLVDVRLEGKHRLGLILAQPYRLKIQVYQGIGQVLQSVPGDVEDVEIRALANLRGQILQLVVSQRQDPELFQVA
jgi:hypothetical protein